MIDDNHRLVISTVKDLSVVKLDSEGKYADSEQFGIEVLALDTDNRIGE